MVSKNSLRIRMAVAGSVLLLLYLALASVLLDAFGLPITVASLGGFLLVQYKLGSWAAMRSVDSEPLRREDAPWIHDRVDAMSESFGIDPPDVYISSMGMPNAFAVGRRNNGTVVLDESLRDIMDDEELEGIIAHELAHLKNNDSVVMVLGQSIATIIGFVTFLLVAVVGRRSVIAAIVGWIIGSIAKFFVTLIVLAVSRYREYVADGDAADVTGNPTALARALSKIDTIGSHPDAPEVSGQVSSLCIFSNAAGLLSTHPPTEKRIDRLDSSVALDDPGLLKEMLGREGSCPSCGSTVYELWDECADCLEPVDGRAFAETQSSATAGQRASAGTGQTDAAAGATGVAAGFAAQQQAGSRQQCPNCGAVVDTRQEFCGNCGTPAPSAQTSTCPECGTVVPDGQQDCPNCVFSLDGAVAGGETRDRRDTDPTQHSASRAQSSAADPRGQTPDNACPHCGAGVDENWSFCKNCGGDILSATHE